MRSRIVYIVTASMTADVLLRGQLRMLRESGFQISVIVSPGPKLEEISQREDVEIIKVPMAREISPLKDIVSLFKLYHSLKTIQPDIVNASTPKAGLLGMLAAKKAGVPIRIYQQRGLRLETTTGSKHKLLLRLEKMVVSCAHHVVCNSYSLRTRCLELGIGSPSKLIVLGAGSSNGIDVNRFLPRNTPDSQLSALKQKLGLGNGPVVGFVGRLVKDKGIEELVVSFETIAQTIPNVQLLLVGPMEDGDPISSETRMILQSHSHIFITGYIDDTAPYYRLMDILAFPSHREGFPNVPLEAAASGIPVVGYRATGTVDAVVDGESGILVEIGDITGLAHAIKHLLDNLDLAVEMGACGRKLVVDQFASEIVWGNWVEYYSSLVTAHEGSQTLS